jgi:hypothetical protein
MDINRLVARDKLARQLHQTQRLLQRGPRGILNDQSRTIQRSVTLLSYRLQDRPLAEHLEDLDCHQEATHTASLQLRRLLPRMPKDASRSQRGSNIPFRLPFLLQSTKWDSRPSSSRIFNESNPLRQMPSQPARRGTNGPTRLVRPLEG